MSPRGRALSVATANVAAVVDPRGAEAADTADTTADEGRKAERFLVGFILLEMVCQLSLLSSSIGPFRVFVRTAVFATSLLMLFVVRRRGPRHPATTLSVIAMTIVGLELFHPTTNSVVAGTAHFALYLAVLAPLFWVPRLALDLDGLRKLLLVLWMFHVTSAIVGALQVYYPGQFQPNISSIYNDDNLEGLRFTLANGTSILRPMGLTDTPGGAAAGGFYCVLLGTGFLLDRPRWWQAIVFSASCFLGMFVLYLCQVRSLVLMLLVYAAAMMVILALTGRIARVGVLAVVVVGAMVAAFALAAAIGGESVTNRWSTLLNGNPQEVYYRNRGIFLEYTVTDLLGKYPFGAGLGRWGMASAYFADRTNVEAAPIYVEIQWTGWLLDGGVPLVVAYASAVILTIVYAARAALGRIAGNRNLWLWATVILGYDLAWFVVTFNCPAFVSSGGLEFWLLNGALFVVCVRAAGGTAVAGPQPEATAPIPHRRASAARRYKLAR